MTHKTLDEIKGIYIKRYPQLAHTTSDRIFCQNALRLAMPTGITLFDVWFLAEIANS